MCSQNQEVDINQTHELADKWTSAAQEILEQLCRATPQPSTIAGWLEALQIPAELVNYNVEDECFD